MTVDQAVKKFKLEPLNVYTAKAKAKELNVEEVLYMNVQKNKYAYIVKDGARGYVLYQDEKSIYSKMYKGLKMTPLEPVSYTHLDVYKRQGSPLNPYFRRTPKRQASACHKSQSNFHPSSLAVK